jgi:hypothetical protein
VWALRSQAAKLTWAQASWPAAVQLTQVAGTREPKGTDSPENRRTVLLLRSSTVFRGQGGALISLSGQTLAWHLPRAAHIWNV